MLIQQNLKFFDFTDSSTLPIWTAYHTFLESRPPDITKNICVLSTRQSQIPSFLGSSSF